MDIKLNTEISLRNLSTLAVVTRLWGNHIIVQEIEKYRKEISRQDAAAVLNDWKKWCSISMKAVDQLKALNLTSDLQLELRKMVLFIGDKIFLWFVYAVKELLFNFKYSQKMYWTPNGLINENKIYQDWRMDPTFPGFHNYYGDKIALYSLACINADENFIRHNLKEIANVAKVYTGVKIKDVNKFKVNSAMTILLIHYFASRSHTINFQLLYSTLKSKEYPNGTDILFFYCGIYGFERAAEYFYKKLKESDKIKKVLGTASECVNDSYQKINFNYEKERLSKSLIYLLGKLPAELKRVFLLNRIVDVHTIFLSTWPYQELCIPILDYIWDALPSPSQRAVLKRTADVCQKMSETRQGVYMAVVQPIMQNILRRFPNNESQ